MRTYAESVACLSNLHAAAEIAVVGNGRDIANGDVTPNVNDHTNFDSIFVTGFNGITRTFTIENRGAAALNLNGTPRVQINSPTGEFTVTALPGTTSIASGASATFQVQFDPFTTGTKTAVITIPNSDGDEGSYTFTVSGTGMPDNAATTSFGTVGAIPDNNVTGLTVNIPVSGLLNPIADLDVVFGGTASSVAPSSTQVGLNHSRVGDLVITLTSPAATSVVIVNRPGPLGSPSLGTNFYQTRLDDQCGGSSIQQIAADGFGSPFTGSFLPANPLSAFNGQNGNGVWQLKVQDLDNSDASPRPEIVDTGVGSLRNVQLRITPSTPVVTAVREFEWSLMP